MVEMEQDGFGNWIVIVRKSGMLRQHTTYYSNARRIFDEEKRREAEEADKAASEKLLL